MAIPDKIIDEIQERTDIVEVVSRYVTLKKFGRNFKGLCPFHHEKTPSFVVSPDKQIYHCFGCGSGGNAFSFLMKHENIDFPEAVETLGKKVGIAVPRAGGRNDESSLALRLYEINEAACQFFQASLAQSNAAQEYLRSRGIGSETVKQFKIGYAPDAWDSLAGSFAKKGVGEVLLEKAGLVIKHEERGTYYDRFRKRIVFPIVDLKGRTLGFGARVLDASLPKYINSPETVIYSKGKNLYGLAVAKDAIKKERHVLIVEGYLDLIIPYQAGVQNVVATLGTALTIDQVRALKRFTKTAVMVYDPDEAGEAASMRNLDIFISEDVNVYIAELPPGHDPDGYVHAFGADEFRRLIKKSKNIFDYKFDKLAARFDITSANGKTAVAGEILPTIARINNAIMRSELVKKLAERLSVDEDSIRSELGKVKADRAEPRFVAAPVAPARETKRAELMVLALILEGGDVIDRVASELSLDEFKDTSVRDVVKAVFEFRTAGTAVTPSRLMTHLGNSPEGARLVSEAASIVETLADKEQALGDCIARIKKDNMKDRLIGLQRAIKAAHDAKNENAVKQLVEEYNGLVRNPVV